MDLHRAVTVSLVVVGVVVGGLLALVAGFQVPTRVGPLSLGAGLALLSIGPYAHALGRASRSTLVGAAPAVAWLGVTMFLATVRSEGDLVVTGSAFGLAFLLLGTVSSAVGIGTIRSGIERADRRAAARAQREAAARAEAAAAAAAEAESTSPNGSSDGASDR